MEIRYFTLGPAEKSKVINIIRIVFGFICIAVAVFWISFNTSLLKTDGTLWITIAFLAGFGLYQIWSGFGRTTTFIEIGSDFIRIKKNPVMPPVRLTVSAIEKIELFPMNIVFFQKSNKKLLLRFGSTYHETNEMVKDAILDFADARNIPLEVIEEKI